MRAARLALALAATGMMALPALAQPRQLPVLDTSRFHAGTFDVRAFDPLGMPEQRALMLAEGKEAVAPSAPAAGMANLPQASAEATRLVAGSSPGRDGRALSGSLFSEGWSRDGFGTQR